VLEAFERELGIEVGQTSEDGAFELGTIECLGGCGWATVIAVNDRQRVGVSADDVPALVEELRG
jgi:NADH-quinone oxidoreductase subunit E